MTQGRPPQREKKPYAAPRLVYYGDVRTLAQSGSMWPNEFTWMGMMFGMRPSDRALKENIVRVGSHPLGIGLYLFDYAPALGARYGHGRQLGVMADEVAAVLPRAVSVDAQGHAVVDYDALGVLPGPAPAAAPA